MAIGADVGQLLGQLNGQQQMLNQLVEAIPEAACYTSWISAKPPIAWLLGRAVYVETWWLRERLQGDDSLTAPVAAIFATERATESAAWQRLPPRDHLLNWASQLQEENLTRLANAKLLPEDALLNPKANPLPLLVLILHSYAEIYEAILAQMSARQQQSGGYQVVQRLTALPPSDDHGDQLGGHFRIGARDDLFARDSELPPQMVELSSFRIDKQAVSNGAWLTFMQQGGYEDPTFWSEAGWQWRQRTQIAMPQEWQQDSRGEWYGVGLNGGFDLIASDAVCGISRYEAEAYARWVATQGELWQGAVIQHEFQWEVALRARVISRYGQVWEWCANPFEPYSGYQPPADPLAAEDYVADHFPLRGGSLHTQRILRRLTYRSHASAAERHRFSGVRLVFPPSDMPWHHQ
ncbi:MAG: SUMF1/EgtB/PvdO family nonheme iron enzyme [Gammaproteobacteria bacterium]|nr:SUMF1/EgtB/PvdO family nonheme iron enzyme [Gammaproteobacteria bacterium]